MNQARQSAAALTAPSRHLGTVVRAARTAQGLTLVELGKRTGYSAAQVSRYERAASRR